MTQYCINYISWKRFLELRERLFKAIKETIADPDATWKSYEGAFDITYSLPNYFEEQDNAKAKWIIHLSCYLIGPHRGEDWEGEDFDEALDRVEVDINKWLEEHEEWMKGKTERIWIE